MYQTHRPWIQTNLEARIAAHVHAWNQTKKLSTPLELEKRPFVTITREFGCEALPLAEHLVSLLNERYRPTRPWVFYDREVLERTAQELHLRKEIVESVTQYRRNEMTELFDALLNRHVDEALVFRKLAEVVRSLAIFGHAVLVGRGGYLITQDLKNSLHIRLEAPRAWRIHRVAAAQQLSEQEAAGMVDELQTERARFLRTFFYQDPKEPFRFDLVIDNARFTSTQMAELVFSALTTRFGAGLCTD